MVRDTAYNDKTNYFKEIADMLNNQLISLENSITKLHINDIDSKKLLYLPVTLINNDNPAIDKSKPGFKDDTKGAKMTIDQLKQIEIQIDERKRGKKSEVNFPGS